MLREHFKCSLPLPTVHIVGKMHMSSKCTQHVITGFQAPSPPVSATVVKSAEKPGLGSRAGKSKGSIAPFQIIERAFAPRAKCCWDKEVILSRSCFVVLLSVLPVDSSFILLTSCET